MRELLDEATRPAEKLGDVVIAFARERDVDFSQVERSEEAIESADFS